MPQEHWGALEADLLTAGLSLDDYPARLNLRAIRWYVYHFQRGATALGRSINGASSDWGYPEELLTRVLETLRDANWQRAGNKALSRPEPMPRPGRDGPIEAVVDSNKRGSVQHFAGTPMSIEEFHRAWEGEAA